MEPSLSGGFDEAWVDPIIGVRYIRILGKNQRFWLNARADFSTEISSDTAINIQIGGGWNISKLIALTLQYRYLEIDYDNGERGPDFWALNLTQQGILLGLAFHF